jgi:GGDEF domain-containing protein
MGLKDAKKYISDLHRRQDDPLLWPDYLTGLPNAHAIIKILKDAYPKLGKYAIAYICIADVNTYLIKYGSDRHAEIIQWAAAILKTTADSHNCFVGASKSHDFVAVGRKQDVNNFLVDASRLFDRKVKSFYGEKDLSRKSVLSFVSDGKEVNVGLMRLAHSVIDSRTEIPREEILAYLEESCLA